MPECAWCGDECRPEDVSTFAGEVVHSWCWDDAFADWQTQRDE